jgi:hypothetical protein
MGGRGAEAGGQKLKDNDWVRKRKDRMDEKWRKIKQSSRSCKDRGVKKR